MWYNVIAGEKENNGGSSNDKKNASGADGIKCGSVGKKKKRMAE